MPYQWAKQVCAVRSSGGWGVLNWLNFKNFFIEDPRHPVFKILNSDSLIFDPFDVNGSPDTWAYLRDNIFVVEQQEEVKPYIATTLHQISTSSDILNLILMPVDQACNFDCVYCYENHQYARAMKSADLKIITEFVEARAPKAVQVEFFGGEPLLAKRFIFSLSSKLQDLSATEGFTYSASMTTNGFYLDLTTFERLYSLGVKQYQITLDGLPEDHNNLRPLKGGGATFDTILNNLLDIKKCSTKGANIVIRVNYNRGSMHLEKLGRFNDEVCSLFSGDDRFHFIFKPISSYGSPNAGKAGVKCSQAEASVVERNLLEVLKNTGSDVGTILSYLKRSHFCYAGRGNNFLLFPSKVDSKGPFMEVGKCTVALKEAVNKVGVLRANGKLDLNANFEKWVANIESFEEKCVNCYFVTQCFSSSCPSANIEYDAKVCPSVHLSKSELTEKALALFQPNHFP